MKAKLLVFTSFLIVAVCTRALSQQQAYFGFGAGFDYGGLGVKAEVLPVKNLGIFAGLGYNLDKPSFNAGLSLKVLPGRSFTPVIMAMYGYNAVIRIKPTYGEAEGKTYYGATIGGGFELFGKKKKNKLSMALLIPFRSSSFHDDYDALKRAGYNFSPDVVPVAFTIGYNIRLNPSKK